MVKITNGRNTLVVPTSAYNEQFEGNGWQLIAKKKTDSVIKKDNEEIEIKQENNSKKKK